MTVEYGNRNAPGDGPFDARPAYESSHERVNDAVIPATQGGNGYDWIGRHEDVLEIKGDIDPDLVFIGDSITHFWGGLPTHVPSGTGTPPEPFTTGEEVFRSAFAGHRVLNLGFGSDRTQQVLWRLDHGELDGLTPTWVVINVGTNNTSDGQTAQEVMAGIEAVCDRVKELTPDARIILMSLLPRAEEAGGPRRELIDEINPMIVRHAQQSGFTHLDIGAAFIDADGSIPASLMPDFCHPAAQGYRIWADALTPLLN